VTDACDRGLWIGLVVTLLVCGCLGGLAASSVSDGATDAESQSQLAPPSSDAPQQSLVIAHDDEATDPDDGEEPDDGHLETDYFSITYHEQYAEPAENIADIADDHYVVLHQKLPTSPTTTTSSSTRSSVSSSPRNASRSSSVHGPTSRVTPSAVSIRSTASGSPTITRRCSTTN